VIGYGFMADGNSAGFEIDRIEVVKGLLPTLYGSEAVGGLMST